MGIISRFTEIMKANINAMLDKAEDPEKMVDQTLRNLREDLARVKEATASVMAEEKGAKRELDECDAEIERMGTAAKRAVAKGNDDDARVLLQQKANLVAKREGLQATYDVMHENVVKTRQMHDKLVSDIKLCESRADSIKAKIAAADAQERVARATAGIDTAKSVDAFNRLEAEANRRLDKASAAVELGESGQSADADELASLYTSGASSVEDELAALKAELAMEEA